MKKSLLIVILCSYVLFCAFWQLQTTGQIGSCVRGNDSDTVLLIHSDATDGSTTFTDSGNGATPYTVTATGDVHHSDNQYKFGISGISFDQTNDYLTIADDSGWAFSKSGTSDFTIEGWIYVVDLGSGTSNSTLWSQGGVDSNNYAFIRIKNNGVLDFAHVAGGTSTIGFSSNAGEIVAASWYHIELVRSGDNFILFKSGVSTVSSVDTDMWKDFAGDVTIGATSSNNPAAPPSGTMLMGYIDEFMISEVARHTANFNVESRPYCD